MRAPGSRAESPQRPRNPPRPEAELDGRAILRVDGKLYPRQLVRVTADPALEKIIRVLKRKYEVPASVEAVESGYLWLFEMAPPRQGV